MHLNYYFLKHLTKELETMIVNSELLECYSQNKDEIILGFSNGESDFFIKAIFNGSYSLLSFPKEPKRAKKNSIDLFETVTGHQIKQVYVFENERSFGIKFKNNFTLVFKLHGNRSNILLFENHNVVTVFRNNLSSDKNIQLSDLSKNLDQSHAAIKESGFDLQEIFPTFGKRILNHVFLEDFESVNEDQKLAILEQTIKKLSLKKFYIQEEKGLPYLTLLPDKDKEVQLTTDSAIEAANYLVSKFTPSYHLNKEKKVIINRLTIDLKKCNAYIFKSNKQLSAIKKSISHEEIANILMANLHVKHQNNTKIDLHDFYRNKPITIKLKRDLPLQKNAEIYYRKSKNQQLEINTLKKNIATKEKTKESLEMELHEIQQLESLKDLMKYNKTNITKPRQKEHFPYFDFEIDGFKVLVGKNAKSNDQLISKFASKNDLWMHARGVSGSHVIIKEKSGSNYPLKTIEKVAELAAWHSKGKNDSLCPVIYTPRKFIRKPKGGLPGQVVVEKEEVILVKPCRNVQ